jgi:hypothetical protein
METKDMKSKMEEMIGMMGKMHEMMMEMRMAVDNPKNKKANALKGVVIANGGIVTMANSKAQVPAKAANKKVKK